MLATAWYFVSCRRNSCRDRQKSDTTPVSLSWFLVATAENGMVRIPKLERGLRHHIWWLSFYCSLWIDTMYCGALLFWYICCLTVIFYVEFGHILVCFKEKRLLPFLKNSLLAFWNGILAPLSSLWEIRHCSALSGYCLWTDQSF